MNRTQEYELIDYLSTLGFFDEVIREEIHEKSKLKLPSFNLQYNVSETFQGKTKTMSYDLHLKRDLASDTYLLDKYRATYHQPMIINHGRFNGIDSSGLEERMKTVNWEQYFKNDPPNLEEGQYDEAIAIMNDLLRLSADNNASGWDVGRRLQYKYWPEQFHDEATKSLNNELQYSRTFTANEQGICNLDQAEDILLGKVNEPENRQDDTSQKRKIPVRKLKGRRI